MDSAACDAQGAAKESLLVPFQLDLPTHYSRVLWSGKDGGWHTA